MTGVRAVACGVALLALAWPASAARLPTDIRPLHYQLLVTPDFDTATYEGDLVIDLQVETATNRITLNAVGLEVYRAEALLPFGRTLRTTITADAAAQTVVIGMPTRLRPGNLKLRLEFGGRLRDDKRGFHLARSYGRKYALTRTEPTGARRAFPCFDEPAFTASFAVSVVAPDGVTAISNGGLVSDMPGPDSGKHTLRFGTTTRMSSYLLALAVGEFQCLERTVEGMPIRACAPPEKRDLGGFALDAAEQAFVEHSRYFALRYPFRKLDLVAVPGGPQGWLGNTGAVFFDEQLLVDPASAPESALARFAESISQGVARQWLGGVVTIRWWDDLWISEGVAAWLAPKPLLAWKPQWRLDRSIVTRTNAAMRFDSLPSAPAVRTAVDAETDMEGSVGKMASTKAAAILLMLEASAGADAVRAGINAFVRARAYEPAAGEELWSHLTAATGAAVDRVMRPAITMPGVPVVGLESSCEGSETVVTVTQGRFPAGLSGPAARPDTWVIPLAIRGVGVEAPTLTFTTYMLGEPRQVFRMPGCYPAVIANAGAAGYFYTAYTPEALARLASLSRDRLTPVERIRLLEDAWALSGMGSHGVGDYLTLVDALAADPTPEVIEEIADGLEFIQNYLLPAGGRAPFEAWIRRTFGAIAGDLGWRVAPGETADRQRLRAAVLGILGSAAHDPTVLSTARALAAARSAGAQPVSPSLTAVVTRLAASTADAELIPRLQSLDARETIAHASDAAFVTRALGDGLAGGDPQGRIAAWLTAALENPAVHAQAWQFLKSRWNDLEPTLTAPSDLSSVVAATGAFCEGTMRADVQRFFGEKAGVPPRTLRLALDRIDACRDRRLRLEGPIMEWVQSRMAETPAPQDRGSKEPRYDSCAIPRCGELLFPDTALQPTTKHRH